MDDRGFATLAVLVYLGILSAAMAALLTNVRPNLELARIGADDLVADGLTEAGLEAVAYLLFDSKLGASEVNGRRLVLDGGTIRLGVVPDNGRVDLNGSKEALLSGLFESAGGQSMPARVFAERVVDWRDEEVRGDIDGGSPPNRPFRSVEELRYLAGLSPADFERLHPHLTVYNPDGTIDTAVASRVVLSALPGLRPADVQRLIDEREAARAEATGGIKMLDPALNNVAEFVAMAPARVFRLSIDVATTGGSARGTDAVIMAPADEGEVRVLAWAERPNAGEVMP